MANFCRMNPLAIACLGLFVCISFNIATNYVFQHSPGAYDSAFVIDDSHFRNDHPHQLPLYVPFVTLRIEDSKGYGLSNFEAWTDWRTTDLFSHGNGFVKLGPEGRLFGVSMFHQMHCLQIIRSSIVQGDAGYHTRHCLNLLRQAILCASDITLDPINQGTDGTDGIGVVHVCRDWEKVYDFVEQNKQKYLNATA